MRRLSNFVPFPRLLLLFACLVYSAPLAARQRSPGPQPNPGNMPNTPGNSTPVVPLSLNGMVVDKDSNARLDTIRVELHTSNGAVVGIVFTRDNGTFRFDNVGSGTYTLVVDQAGYETVNQQVDVFDTSVYGLQIDLAKTSDSGAAPDKGSATISVRGLSIPAKARDDMEKGIALLYEKSDYPGSLKLFEKAIKEYPDFYEAYTQMGVAYSKLADTANAEKSFRKSMEVSHEQYAGAYVGLGELFLTEQRYADAEPLARKALEIDSTSWQADSILTRALIKLHRPTEAEASAGAAVKLRPNEANLYLLLANAHTELHNDRALLDDLNHYLKLDPTGPFAEQARRERDELQQALATSPSSPGTSPPSQP